MPDNVEFKFELDAQTVFHFSIRLRKSEFVEIHKDPNYDHWTQLYTGNYRYPAGDLVLLDNTQTR